MRVFRLSVAFLLGVCSTASLLAQTLDKAQRESVDTERWMRRSFACLIRRDTRVSHDTLVQAKLLDNETWARSAKTLVGCMEDNGAPESYRFGLGVVATETARAFLANPERIPADAGPVDETVAVPPNPVGSCVARRAPAQARAFLDAVPLLPDQLALLTQMEPIINSCIGDTGVRELTDDRLRGGIALRLYYDMLANRAAPPAKP